MFYRGYTYGSGRCGGSVGVIGGSVGVLVGGVGGVGGVMGRTPVCGSAACLKMP